MKAIDIETTGLDPHRDEILGVGIGSQYCLGVPSANWPEEACYQNGKFDLRFLRVHGYNLPPYTFDTKLAASLLLDRPDSLSLGSLATHYLGVENWKDSTDAIFKKKDWAKKLTPEQKHLIALRNMNDLEYTSQLQAVLDQKLKKEGSAAYFYKYTMPAARLLLDVECRGMGINYVELVCKKVEVELKISKMLWDLNHIIGKKINWNSPKQILELLKEKEIRPQSYNYKKKEVTISTCDEALQSIRDAHPIIPLILQYREQKKLLEFLDTWSEKQYEGRIYPTYNLANTRTGRLSCSEPNLQQVPRDKEIRSLFIPTEGTQFVICDYAQIEPRIAAHYSQDKALTDVFVNKLDFYGSIANRVLGVDCAPNEVKARFPEKRQLAKVIGLSILYGIGAKKLSNFIRIQAGVDYSEAECRAIIREYFMAYPGLQQLRDRVEERVEDKGYITNHYGRKIRIDEWKIFSTGVNSLIQSSASDSCLFAQLPLSGDPKAALVAIVHDEVIYEVEPSYTKEFIAKLSKSMLNQGYNCPLDIEIKTGYDWGIK